MAEFFDMGSFGNYIWGSYGFAVVCLGWLNYASWRKAKTTAEQLATLQACLLYTSPSPRDPE